MSVQNPELQPIIIKKKVVHGGHHGGAWKVAYADFVTAMMALFIVLWLLSSSSPKTRKVIAGYFRDAAGSGAETGSGQAGSGEGVNVGRDDMSHLKDKLESAIRSMPELTGLKDQVAMTVTGEGLRVELLESDVGTFFESGNSKPSGQGTEMLEMLAAELGKLPNRLLIEGHSDSRPFAGTNGYSNWELSADRANMARRLMQEHGIRSDQVLQVRGFADQNLRDVKDPENAANRRVSIIVQYRPGQAPEVGGGARKSESAGGEINHEGGGGGGGGHGQAKSH